MRISLRDISEEDVYFYDKVKLLIKKKMYKIKNLAINFETRLHALVYLVLLRILGDNLTYKSDIDSDFIVYHSKANIGIKVYRDKITKIEKIKYGNKNINVISINGRLLDDEIIEELKSKIIMTLSNDNLETKVSKRGKKRILEEIKDPETWYCTECGEDMGYNNPRQLCGKTYCILNSYINH